MFDIFEDNKALKKLFIELYEESYLDKEEVLIDVSTTEKTFRNYISRINKNEFFEISIVKDLVLLKIKDYYQTERLYQKLKKDAFYYVDKDEMAILESVMMSEYIPLDELAESLYLSKANVYKKIELLDEKLKDKYIHLRGKTSKGIEIIGAEFNLRNLYITSVKDEEEEKQPAVEELMTLFNLDEMEYGLIHNLIRVTVVRRNKLSEAERQLVQELIVEDSITENYLIEIQSIVEAHSGVLLEETEAKFIYLNIINRTTNKLSSHQNLMFEAEVKTLIHQALDSIHERYTIQLDEIGFYEESRHHFLLMMNRLKLGIELKQVLYMEHKQDYSFSHTLSLEFRTVMEALYSLKINDAEIDYITIYIRLYLDRIFKVNDIDKINIVCRSGKGTALLLKEKIKDVFKLQNVRIDISTDLEMDNGVEYDLVFSTITLNNLEPDDYILIEDILDDEYLKRSMGKIFSIQQGKKHQHQTLKDSIKTEDIYLINDDSNYMSSLESLLEELEEDGKISKTFIKTVKERERAGTTLFGRIGMPHAVSEKTVFQVYLQVNQSVKSVYDLIFLLEIPEHLNNENQVIILYEEIMKISKNPQKVKILKQLKSTEEVSYFL